MLTLIGRCQHTTHCSISQQRYDLHWHDCLWAIASAIVIGLCLQTLKQGQTQTKFSIYSLVHTCTPHSLLSCQPRLPNQKRIQKFARGDDDSWNLWCIVVVIFFLTSFNRGGGPLLDQLLPIPCVEFTPERSSKQMHERFLCPTTNSIKLNTFTGNEQNSQQS